MQGDQDYLQRRIDAGGRVVRARWCPAREDVLAVLSDESVRYREEERRLQAAMEAADGKPDAAALASHRALLAARRSSSLVIPSV